jgi:hypothetical protein
MKRQRLINCAICGRIVGENSQSISVSYGFGDHMPVLHEMLVHKECCNDVDAVKYMLDLFELEEY